MVSRRGLLGGASAIAAAILSGCGSSGHRKLEDATAEAAAAVEGVSEAELEMVGGANFERLLRGTLSLEPDDRAAGLSVFDQAMRAIITTIHAELNDAEARSLRVGHIIGMLSGGEEISALELGPEIAAENPRLDRITAESFYSRYGLS